LTFLSDPELVEGELRNDNALRIRRMAETKDNEFMIHEMDLLALLAINF
jgi:hypothetical protein